MIPKYKCVFCIEVFEDYGYSIVSEGTLMNHLLKKHEDKFKYVEIVE